MDFVKVTVGKKDFYFGGSDEDSIVGAQINADLFQKDVASRVRYEDDDGEFVYPKDVRFSVRTNDGGVFPEFTTWSLGEIPATKRWSRHMDYKGKPNGGYFIAFSEPWVRYTKEDGTEAMYDSLQLQVDAEGKGELAELGFDEPNVWYSVKREKGKTKANPKLHYIYKQV